MKIVLLTSRFPYPLEKGDKLRIFYQLRELSKEHEIILCATTDEPVQPADYQAVAKFCSKIFIYPRSRFTIFKNLIFAFFKNLPFQIGFFYDKKIKNAIEKVIETEQPDVIYCQLIRMAEYVRHCQRPKMLDYMDTFSVGAKRWSENAPFLLKPLLQREARQLARYENAVFADFDHHTIISEQDRNLLQLADNQQVSIVPNGVDTDFFYPSERTTRPYHLAFIGNMGYRPNVEAARFLAQEIVPRLLPHFPDLRVLIAGARPTPLIKSLANRHVEVSGWVDDIRTAYSSTQVFIAPLFLGSGLQNKILEAMAMSVPCITTTLVNNAVQATPDREILIADDAETFAQNAIFLLQNPEKRHQIAANGLAFVRNNFSWQHFVKVLIENLKDRVQVNGQT